MAGRRKPAEIPEKVANPNCSVQSCLKPRHAGGLCNGHYHRLVRYGDAEYRPKVSNLSGVDTSLYPVWNAMKNRCYNSNTKSYVNYGGRGIRVCDSWRFSYVRFIEDMGARPAPGMSLDRIDNDGNYSCGHCEECYANGWPANVKWSTRQEQVENSTAVRWITVEGETHTVAQWTRIKGHPSGMIADRLQAGWSEVDAVLVPKGGPRGAF